jgi:lysophospholipase L1-like esterase
MTNLERIDRHARDLRWTGVLSRELPGGYTVIEEGLNGRTTVFDDPIEGAYKNGRAHLETCLESHMPLDLVILMLGTNDLKSRFGVTAADVAMGAGALIEEIRRPRLARARTGGVPDILLIAPPPLGPQSVLADLFAGGVEKSREFSIHFEQVAQLKGCHFLNAGDHVVSSPVDGAHLEAEQHAKLGTAVARCVLDILEGRVGFQGTFGK